MTSLMAQKKAVPAATLPRVPFAVEINADDPRSIEAALRTEWLLTNGLGGYAMGTALGVNTRRYHGLLVAATKPPVGRVVALHSIIEQLIVPREDGSEEVIELSTQQFMRDDGEPMLHPGGFRHLRSFNCTNNDSAQWTWRIRGASISKTISLSASAVVDVNYTTHGFPPNTRLRLRPMIAMRDFHSLNAHDARPWTVEHGRNANWLKIRCGELEGDLDAWNGAWQQDAQKWDRFAYDLDRSRGQDWVENVWSPGYMEIICTDQTSNGGFAASTYSSKTNLIGNVHDFKASSPFEAGASQFVVQRWMNDHAATSVIAGYPWFGDWGRDTMIALPGLMLCTKRFDEARSTLQCFAANLRNGLIPNLFDDYGGAAHYNTVDASLWFVHAVHAYARAMETSRDHQGAESSQQRAAGPLPDGRGSLIDLVSACREIIAAYRRGTDYNIYMDADGLICAGDASTQLTWMDAARDGVVFTPRFGKPVEINALWHNALICLSELTNSADERNDLVTLARTSAASFRSAFWWDDRQCLHDCLVPLGRDETSGAVRFLPDGKVRPNQVFAASLPFSPLNDVQRRAVVKIVGERLLTPFGLRTLDRDDPNYKPRYEGNLFERDSAYHNGTVWPWLIGPYCEALLRVEDFSAQAKQRVRELLGPLTDEMSNTSGGRCLGQIAEVYDGEPPHRPSGCPAQAWSVAETLRAMMLASDDR